jgi:hypothetical protein
MRLFRSRDALVARLVKTSKRPPDPLCCTPADALPLLILRRTLHALRESECKSALMLKERMEMKIAG